MVNYLKLTRFGFSMAAKSVGRRKFRAALTILGVLIGIATIVSLISIGEGMQYGIESTLKELVGASVVIRSGDQGINVPEYVSDYVLRVPGVKDCVSVVMMLGEIGSRQSMIIGVNMDQAADLLQISLTDGRLFELGESYSAVVSSATADRLGLNVGDTIALSAMMGGVGESYTVVGIAKPVSGFLTDTGCFIPLRDAQRLFNKPGLVSLLLVTIEDSEMEKYVAEVLMNAFPEANIMTEEALLSSVREVMGMVNGVLLALGSISLAVGTIGVMNTITMTVYERTREIGMIKAIGGRRRHVLSIFLSEAAIMGVIGGLLGIVVGIAFVYGIQHLVSALALPIAIPVVVSPQTLLIGLGLSLAITTMAGFYPSWKASNIPPIEALKYE